jgi:hypothetical protein
MHKFRFLSLNFKKVQERKTKLMYSLETKTIVLPNFYDKRNNLVYLLVVFTSPMLWTTLFIFIINYICIGQLLILRFFFFFFVCISVIGSM